MDIENDKLKKNKKNIGLFSGCKETLDAQYDGSQHDDEILRYLKL